MNKEFKKGDVVYFGDQLAVVIEANNHIEEEKQIWKDLGVDPFSESQDLWLDCGEFDKLDGSPELRFSNSSQVNLYCGLPN